jgi:hypothetical protein
MTKTHQPLVPDAEAAREDVEEVAVLEAVKAEKVEEEDKC